MLIAIIRFEARLLPNIGFTLRRNFAVTTDRRKFTTKWCLYWTSGFRFYLWNQFKVCIVGIPHNSLSRKAFNTVLCNVATLSAFCNGLAYIRLSVCLSVRPIGTLTVTHCRDSIRRGQRTFPSDNKGKPTYLFFKLWRKMITINPEVLLNFGRFWRVSCALNPARGTPGSVLPTSAFSSKIVVSTILSWRLTTGFPIT